MLQKTVAIVIAVIGLLAPQTSMAQEGRAPGIAAIVARNEFVVALPAFDSSPFFYSDSKGVLYGFDIDLAHAIGRELGVPVRFDRSAKSFDDVVAIVARGNADAAICKLSRTLKRAQDVRFTDPYASFKHALVVNRVAFAKAAEGREPPEVIHDFLGTLGVIKNSSFADYARINFPDAMVQEYATWPDLVDAVQSGKVVAAYRDEFEIKKIIVDDPALSLTLRTITLSDLTDTLGIATAAGDGQFVAFLDMYISQRVGLKSADDLLKLVPASRAVLGETR